MTAKTRFKQAVIGWIILVGLLTQSILGLAQTPGGQIFIPFVQSSGSSKSSSVLKARVTFPKPANISINADQVSTNQVVLKFAEGTHIRLQSGQLVFNLNSLTQEELDRMARQGLTPTQIQNDLNQINARLLKQVGTIDRMFFLQSTDVLASQKQQGEALSGEELADLDLYYNLFLTVSDAVAEADLVNFLNSFKTVEIAYPAPIPFLAAADIPPATVISPALTQGYLDPAGSNGIDARYAWTYPGGRGDGVQLVDVEVAWQLDHEDLPGSYFYSSGIFVPFASYDHGTAVLGELGAQDNGYGATGIVPNLSLGWGSPTFAGFPNFFYNVPAAISNAASHLSFGDIIQIEQHYPGPTGGHTCTMGNCGQFAYVPVEFYQGEFDAIHNATAMGVIVTEAAGNGQMNLDDPMYGGRFNPSVRDSGAILVGAGGSTNRVPEGFSNFGTRVNVQGWGDSVDTLGFGDIQINGSDQRQWYTRTFSGTSSATPIVSGAVAAIQGVRSARGMGRLSPSAMRSLLISTGTPQGADPRQVGPLPDLHMALNSFLPNVAIFVSQSVPATLVTNQTQQVSVTYRNAGTAAWTSSQNYNLGSQNPQDNVLWGSNRTALPGSVNPGSQVTFTYTITAPPIPGTYNFQTRMVQDGVEWFGDLSPSISIVVTKDNQAHFVSQSIPTTMNAGHSYPISVTYQNSGMTDWFLNQGYAMGFLNPILNTTWSSGQVKLPAAVVHGNQVTFNLTVVAPLVAGQYNFQTQMLQNNTEWFGDISPNVSVNVVSAANNAQFVSQTTPALVLTDTLNQVKVTMKNIGTTTWTAGAQYFLGSQNPQDNMTWEINRVALPGPVAPGATVTFTFEISCLVPGSKNFQWRMVQDGVEWFGEYTPNAKITVRLPPQ